MNTGMTYALLAALLFGASTPFAKLLIGQIEPVLLAALLYLGSGIGLSLWRLLRRLAGRSADSGASLTASDLPWLAGAVFAGGIVGPVLLMTGLRYVSGATASLLLNMEGVLTALIAWFVFREHFDRRIFIGMVFIISAGVLLAGGNEYALDASWGALCVVAACLCWAIDNNLTRKVSASDAVQIAAVKGLVAGIVNLAFALFWLGLPIPTPVEFATAGLIGFSGYGLSLVLFVLALRHLGTARTGAYFSTAPFAGAIIALLMLGEQPDPVFWIAAALMVVGIWLHLTETHEHMHSHTALSHTHSHRHDEHHQHAHDFVWDGKEPHTHPHEHAPLTHRHPHFPDIHHRHRH
ncbi:MAG TPA: EamA family transporter [Noviherbaspirillum sp.]|uniref:DMT family transporter n=1 Tax=Noviherbaspirillum sp. TaxID=1926288 RepID=UPI002B49A991|nr:EamA family transporter [Noviherbaspirillum sp.]HJV88362.1 EamA family transporter [Noviherbaspirillum sp.]